MSDMFDAVSIFKSTDTPLKSNHAKQAIDEYAEQRHRTRGVWCLCRFVPREHTFGWPLRHLVANVDPYGWSEEADVALFATMEDAHAAIAKSPFARSKAARDEAVAVERLLWRVLITSTYDASRVEAYRGSNLADAQTTLMYAREVVRGNSRLRARLEGVVEG